MRIKYICLGFLVFFFLTFSIYSCIEVFRPELDITDTINLLVVEGKVTDETGPFKVRLSRSGAVYTYQTSNSFEPVPDADVFILDDKGNNFQLYPVENGWYETIDKNLKGIPGNTYTLHITDNDGNQYVSTPELLLDVPPIGSVFYHVEQRTHFAEDEVTYEDWLTVLLNTQSSGDGIHYFKWEFEETWEFKMPEYIPVVWKNDNGAFYTTMEEVEVSPEKLHCWITEASKSILVKSTADNLTGKINEFPVTSIGPEDDRLGIRYSIRVKQFAINKELYNFFKKLEAVNETNGGIYDRIPAPVYGNILTASGSKKVLGYFLASSVKSTRIFIDRSDINIKTGSAYRSCGWGYKNPYLVMYFYGITQSDKYEVWSVNKYCTDCRERGTGVKPEFW